MTCKHLNSRIQKILDSEPYANTILVLETCQKLGCLVPHFLILVDSWVMHDFLLRRCQNNLPFLQKLVGMACCYSEWKNAKLLATRGQCSLSTTDVLSAIKNDCPDDFLEWTIKTHQHKSRAILELCAVHNRPGAATLLIENGVSVTEDVLQKAAIWGNVSFIIWLHDNHGIPYGNSAEFLVSYGHLADAEELLSRGAEISDVPLMMIHTGAYGLVESAAWAIDRGYPFCDIFALSARGANLELCEFLLERGHPKPDTLLDFIFSGDPLILQWAHGQEIPLGENDMFVACFEGNYAVVFVLLETFEAEISGLDLHAAIRENHCDFVQCVLNKLADDFVQTDSGAEDDDYFSALSNLVEISADLSAQYNRIELLKFLYAEFGSSILADYTIPLQLAANTTNLSLFCRMHGICINSECSETD